jgi:hypothetical protein
MLAYFSRYHYTPRKRGRERTEFAARADSTPHENAL